VGAYFWQFYGPIALRNIPPPLLFFLATPGKLRLRLPFSWQSPFHVRIGPDFPYCVEDGLGCCLIDRCDFMLVSFLAGHIFRKPFPSGGFSLMLGTPLELQRSFSRQLSRNFQFDFPCLRRAFFSGSRKFLFFPQELVL